MTTQCEFCKKTDVNNHLLECVKSWMDLCLTKTPPFTFQKKHSQETKKKCIFCLEESKDPHHLLVCESMAVQEAKGGRAHIILSPINLSKCKRKLLNVEFYPPGDFSF